MTFQGKPPAVSRWFEVRIVSSAENAPYDRDAEVVRLEPPWPVRGDAADRDDRSVAPSDQLMRQWAAQGHWDEFRRRYQLELKDLPEPCERLRRIACERPLVLIDASGDPERRVAIALREHLERLECQRRWDAGLMLGGMTWPLKQEILDAGGLWYGRHKAWMLPDEQSLARIRKLLPGDF